MQTYNVQPVLVTMPVQNLVSADEIIGATKTGVDLAGQIAKMFNLQQEAPIQNLVSADEIIGATKTGVDLAGQIAKMFNLQQQPELENMKFSVGGAVHAAEDGWKFGKDVYGLVKLQELVDAGQIIGATKTGVDLAGQIAKMFNLQQQQELQNLVDAGQIIGATKTGVDLAGQIASMFNLQQQPELENMKFSVGGAVHAAEDGWKFGKDVYGLVKLQELVDAGQIIGATKTGVDLAGQIASMFNLQQQPELQNMKFSVDGAIHAAEDGWKFGKDVYGLVKLQELQQQQELQNLVDAGQIIGATKTGVDLAGQIAKMF